MIPFAIAVMPARSAGGMSHVVVSRVSVDTVLPGTLAPGVAAGMAEATFLKVVAPALSVSDQYRFLVMPVVLCGAARSMLPPADHAPGFAASA